MCIRDSREHMCLIEGDRVLVLVGRVLSRAARDRIREPTEEASVGLVAKEGLEAERATASDVARTLHDQAIELLVPPLDADLDLPRELLLDADAALHRRAREALREILARVDAWADVPRLDVLGVVEAHAGHDAAAGPGHE